MDFEREFGRKPTARDHMRMWAWECELGKMMFREYGMPRRLTRANFYQQYPYRGIFPKMRCVSDVISTLEGLMESLSKSSSESSIPKERAALAAEVLAEVVLYTLTTHTGQESSEVSFARLVTRHFEKFGMTQESLTRLLDIFVSSRQLQFSEKSV